MTTKNRIRHNRAYAAGARDALAKVSQIVGPALDPRQRSALTALLQNIQKQDFPMPPPNGALDHTDKPS